ncbi:MAG: DegV family protein [Clostridia bacterium]|nr:DegV family protein [Clostridia bacterium]
MSTNKTYVILTDSSCDLHREVLDEWQIGTASLTFRFDGEDKEYTNDGMDINEFYSRMKAGGVAKTAAVNTESFIECFTPYLEGGLDILYIGFSSGLSTTFNSARLASIELKEKYPERKIVAVDSLCASAGGALLVRLALDKREAGAEIEACAEFVESIKLSICHWFTVDDLVYLKRGGRVSSTAAFFGNMLGIKPVMHVDNEGHLVNVEKVRGRKTAIEALAQKYGELRVDGDYPIYISQADSTADAERLASILKSKYGAEVSIITDVGPVIGAHSGPGTLALFFVGKER